EYSIEPSVADSINRALAEGRRVIAVGTTTTRALEAAARVKRHIGPRTGAQVEPRTGAQVEPRTGAQVESRAGAQVESRTGAQASRDDVEVAAGRTSTDLFIYPGFDFRVVSGLITNFHLPESSLLMLVCAFGGREPVLTAYRHAVDEAYRFYSYGDAM